MRERWIKIRRKGIAFLFCLSLLICTPGNMGAILGGSAAAGTSGTVMAQTTGLNKTSVVLTPGQTVSLKLNGAGGGIKWSVSNKKIISVSSVGKVMGIAKGTAMVRGVYKGVTYRCTVVVQYGTYKSADGMRYKDAGGTFGYTGRWFKKSISGGKYYYTSTDGSTIYFKVSGTKYVDVNFVSKIAVATPYFSYSIDGGKMRRQKISKKRISVGNTKVHYIRLVIDGTSEHENKWSGEAGVGIKSIKSVTKGGVITAIKPQNLTIAFYGDSITQGVRALNMALMPSGTSAVNSYAWFCAAELDMIPYFAGYGGSGIQEKGSFTNCYNVINKFSATRAAQSFDADVIVVEHGTNDVNTDSDTFIRGYKKVLKKLHSQHPNAEIMAMIPFTQVHASDIRAAADAYNWCNVVETSSWKISYTDGLHPNSRGAKTVGKKLAGAINSASATIGSD